MRDPPVQSASGCIVRIGKKKVRVLPPAVSANPGEWDVGIEEADPKATENATLICTKLVNDRFGLEVAKW